jgi:hypothetical protein
LGASVEVVLAGFSFIALSKLFAHIFQPAEVPSVIAAPAFSYRLRSLAIDTTVLRSSEKEIVLGTAFRLRRQIEKNLTAAINPATAIFG